jgi:two-component system nitrogen regulation sensor histidine kinase NtrY
MIQQIDTLNRIANAFSDFASLNTQNLESISIIEAVKDVIHIFKNNNVQLVSEINASDLIKVYVDKTHLTRVLNNLIQNALQSQREGIPIKVVVEIKTKKNHCVILVKDNGTGIPKNIRDKIFEPNFTTKNSGTGLGLAMVKRIIDDFGGRITYLTNLEGTVFEVSIPLEKN